MLFVIYKVIHVSNSFLKILSYNTRLSSLHSHQLHLITSFQTKSPHYTFIHIFSFIISNFYSQLFLSFSLINFFIHHNHQCIYCVPGGDNPCFYLSINCIFMSVCFKIDYQKYVETYLTQDVEGFINTLINSCCTVYNGVCFHREGNEFYIKKQILCRVQHD